MLTCFPSTVLVGMLFLLRPIFILLGGALLVAAVGAAFLIRASGKGKGRAGNPDTGPVQNQLRDRRRQLECERDELLCLHEQLCRQNAENRRLRERCDAIIYAFKREYGLLDRMKELQQELAYQKMTGTLDQEIVVTQLTDMYLSLQKLEQILAVPAEVQNTPLHIPGWIAMEAAAAQTEQELHPNAQAAAAETYRQALDTAAQNVQRMASQLRANLAAPLPEPSELPEWELHLQQVQQMLTDPRSMTWEQQLDTAKQLAEYARANFQKK